MAISHIKSVTVADFTGTVTVFNSAGATTTANATDLVRPADWNSIHNQYYSLGGNTSLSSTASGSNVVYAASGALSLIGSGASVVWSAPMGSTMELVPVYGAATGSVALGNASSAPMSIWPFIVPTAMSAGILDMIYSASFVTLGTSSGRQTMGIRAGVYSRATGTNSTNLTLMTSWSVEYQVTGNNSSYTISQPTATNYAGYTLSTTASAGSNISSQYTGLKKIQFPISSFLPPGQYWLGLMGTNSTSSINVGISLSYWGAQIATQATGLAPMGSLSANYSLGTVPGGGAWQDGYGQWSSTNSQLAVPVSINFTSVTVSANSIVPYLRLWST